LLGEVFAGILCSDRGASYLKYHNGEGQIPPSPGIIGALAGNFPAHHRNPEYASEKNYCSGRERPFR